MQEEKGMASKDCCCFDLMTLGQSSLPKVIQVEKDRAGIQSRSFDLYFTFAPSFLILSLNNCLTIWGVLRGLGMYWYRESIKLIEY